MHWRRREDCLCVPVGGWDFVLGVAARALVGRRYADTYQGDLDTMPIFKILPAFVLLGCSFHGHLNHSPFFDSMWTVGLWFDTVAMLPQLSAGDRSVTV